MRPATRVHPHALPDRYTMRARIAGCPCRTVLRGAVAGVGLVSKRARRRRRGDPRLPLLIHRLGRQWITWAVARGNSSRPSRIDSVPTAATELATSTRPCFDTIRAPCRHVHSLSAAYGVGVAPLMASVGPTSTTSPTAASVPSFRISPLILPGM